MFFDTLKREAWPLFFMLVRMTGHDCRFRFAETYGSHQFLHWWQQVSTGHLHLDGFET